MEGKNVQENTAASFYQFVYESEPIVNAYGSDIKGET